MKDGMLLTNVKVAVLENATGSTLQADFNDLTAGKAIATSGTFPAGWVVGKTFLAVLVDGDRLVLVYTE